MKKVTDTRTATTFTLPAAMYDGWDAETKAELMKPSVWPTEEGARQAIERLSRWHQHTVNFAPGLEVHAFYEVDRRTGQRYLVTVIVIEGNLAADLHTAVQKQQPVTVSYTKADGTDTVRTVEPRDVVETTAGSLIVRGIDRESEGTRSFRLDRISTYTVHRTRFTVRTETPAPRKTDLVATFRLGGPRPAFAGPAARVQSATEGFKGRTLPETREQGPTGWTVKVRLEDPWTGLTPSGTVRVPEGDLIRL